MSGWVHICGSGGQEPANPSRIVFRWERDNCKGVVFMERGNSRLDSVKKRTLRCRSHNVFRTHQDRYEYYSGKCAAHFDRKISRCSVTTGVCTLVDSYTVSTVLVLWFVNYFVLIRIFNNDYCIFNKMIHLFLDVCPSHRVSSSCSRSLFQFSFRRLHIIHPLFNYVTNLHVT